MLYAYALGFVNEKSVAEDVIQDVFVQILGINENKFSIPLQFIAIYNETCEECMY